MAGEPLTGLIVKMPAAAQLEMSAAAGFDFAIIDLEHGVRDLALLEGDMRAAVACGLPTLVRVPTGDAPTVLAVLDAGAAGVVVPHVSSVTGAADAVKAASYPPRGRRSFALTTPAGRWGATTNDEHLRVAAESVCVVVQLEDREAVAAAQDIAGVEGVDALFIGLNDLALDVVGRVAGDAPAVVAARDAVLEAAATAGKPVMTVVSTPTEAERWRGLGAEVAIYVAPSLTLAAFRAAARSLPDDHAPDPTLPVVLVPGMLEDGRVWDGIVERLGVRLSLVPARIDLDDSIEEMADSLLACAPPRFVLVGHSLGAVVSLEAALRAPQRVQALAVLNADSRPPMDELSTSWARLRERFSQGPGAIGEWVASVLPGAGDPVAGLARRMAEDVGREAALRQLEAQRSRTDMRGRLAGVRCPVLVVCGECDVVSPPDRQQELAAVIPNARLHTLAGCGHLGLLEQPDQTAAALGAWLGLEPDASGVASAERT